MRRVSMSRGYEIHVIVNTLGPNAVQLQETPDAGRLLDLLLDV